MHQCHLGITLSSIAGTLSFRRLANLGQDKVGHDVTGALVQARVDLAHVVLLHPLSQRVEAQGLWVQIRIRAEDVKHDARCRAVISGTDDHTVADDKQQLALIVILELGQRVDSSPQRVFSFGIARNLADNELVVIFWRTRRTEVDRSQELEADDRHHDAGKHQQDVRGELTLNRLPAICFTNGKQIAHASSLPLEDLRVDTQAVNELGNVLAGLLLEHVDNSVVHEVPVDATRFRLSLRHFDAWGGVHVVGEVVDEAAVDGNEPTIVRSISDVARRNPNKAETILISHNDHLLKVPVGAIVIPIAVACRPIRSEVMVDVVCVVRIVDRVEGHIRIDTARLSLAERADLWEISTAYNSP